MLGEGKKIKSGNKLHTGMMMMKMSFNLRIPVVLADKFLKTFCVCPKYVLIRGMRGSVGKTYITLIFFSKTPRDG